MVTPFLAISYVCTLMEDVRILVNQLPMLRRGLPSHVEKQKLFVFGLCGGLRTSPRAELEALTCTPLEVVSDNQAQVLTFNTLIRIPLKTALKLFVARMEHDDLWEAIANRVALYEEPCYDIVVRYIPSHKGLDDVEAGLLQESDMVGNKEVDEAITAHLAERALPAQVLEAWKSMHEVSLVRQFVLMMVAHDRHYVKPQSTEQLGQDVDNSCPFVTLCGEEEEKEEQTRVEDELDCIVSQLITFKCKRDPMHASLYRPPTSVFIGH